MLIKLLESDLPVDCTFVFTVQEEAGARGAFGAAFSVSPDIALVVETTTAADFPSVPASKKICLLGKGVVIPFMDRSTIYNRELYSLLTALADKKTASPGRQNHISQAATTAAPSSARAPVSYDGGNRRADPESALAGLCRLHRGF